PPMQSPTRQGPDTGTGLASAGSTTEWCEKELAPGGHQEQGESRVTEFRAPDSEKHRASKWRIESQLPLRRRVSAAVDERHLKHSGFRRRFHGEPFRSV